MENTNATKSLFVIFLDIDGVLNTRKTCVCAPSGVVGIVESRAAVLAGAMKQTRADGVVLTTTWKNLREDHEDYIYLLEIFSKYGIKVLGKTEEKHVTEREEGVVKYLETHPEIEEFVILDDQQYGFRLYSKLWESFIDTRGQGIEHGSLVSRTPSVAAILFLNAIQS